MKRSIAHKIITYKNFEVIEIEKLNIARNVAKNNNSNVVQSSIIKQHAIKIFKHIRRFNNIINNTSN